MTQEPVIVTNSPAETFAVGRNLARSLHAGSVVALFGELGSGKTTLIQGIASGLGVRQPVSSPSFTLINEYAGRLPIYHFDFYRIKRVQDAWELVLDDYFYGEGVCLLEWADRIRPLLPERRADVYIKHLFHKHQENRREITIVQR
ncbi:MAG: tRNA (adenosine(37)-N6)-threonylcarbamoyltransferase complex ATPase subunit type 1 TsaE [Calditrichaeota bacterium]|nr:MAG: tRNA (adenosine(37)-N6)-threonylcarbamoyltransferase complex ATPase subunit type 1 TsaE [Calditrichota bacterium]